MRCVFPKKEVQMKIRTARNWLGIYFLVSASAVGAFLLIAAHSRILPLEEDEAASIFQIIVPVLVGQIAVVFQWMARAGSDSGTADDELPLPSWAIVLPPVITLLIFFSGAWALAASNAPDSSLHVSPNTFRAIVTFALSILNASTVILVGRIFPVGHGKKARRRRGD
jgi:hypothetical protein